MIEFKTDFLAGVVVGVFGLWGLANTHASGANQACKDNYGVECELKWLPKKGASHD